VAARKAKPLRRRGGSRQQRERFLIYTESDVREPGYLNGLLGKSLRIDRLPGDRDGMRPAVVFGTIHGEPLGMVQAAIQHKRREQQAGDAFSQVWCVFDVHRAGPRPSLDEAMELAERNGISCAVTCPAPQA
jgi:hypothetical protein